MGDFINDDDFAALVATTTTLAGISTELDEAERDVRIKVEDLVYAIKKRNGAASRYNGALEALLDLVHPLLESTTCPELRGDLEQLDLPEVDRWAEPETPFDDSQVFDADQVKLRQRA